MFNRALFRLMIVLSVCMAASLALAQEGNLAEPVVLSDLGEEDNDTVTASDTASVMVVADDNVTEKGDVNDTGAIDEAPLSGVTDSSNETTPSELLPEEELIVIMPDTPMPASSMTVVLAVEDVYADMEKEKVYNDDHLVCEYLMDDLYGDDEFPGMVMVQFDISDLKMSDDDVGVLVLKAESMEKGGDEMVGIFLMPVTSEWSEDSSATALALNMLSTIFMMSNDDDFDFGQLGMNFGGDEVFAFDVSAHLKAAEDGRISFLLMAVGDTDYRVSFNSRETGEGPSLLIGPYPSVPI